MLSSGTLDLLYEWQKKQETEQSARPPVFFIFLLLKVFLLFYLFTFKSPFYFFTLKSLFTFLLFYFFTFKSLFTFLLFYFFTFKSFSSPAIDIIKRLAGSNFIYSKIIKSPMVLVHYTCVVHADIIHQNDTYRWCYIFFFHISSLLLYFFSVHNIYSLRQTFKR